MVVAEGLAWIADGLVVLTVMRPCSLFCDDFEWTDLPLCSAVVGEGSSPAPTGTTVGSTS